MDGLELLKVILMVIGMVAVSIGVLSLGWKFWVKKNGRCYCDHDMIARQGGQGAKCPCCHERLVD